MKYKHIIWDWNGTLLDDRRLCVESINHVMLKRNLPQINKEEYMDSFCFPVSEYYKKLGFDFSNESFFNVGIEFIEFYKKKFHEAALHDDTRQILHSVQRSGLTQSVLSAGEQLSLIGWIKAHELEGCFFMIKGVKDHYASGKLGQGIEMLSELLFKPDEFLLVGDTDHDSDVAKAMGIDCILVSHGHMSYKRLANTGRRVVKNIEEVWQFIKLKNLFNQN